MFSMMLVQARERRSSAGRPRRLTVRISSRPSGGVEFKAAGQISDELLCFVRVVQFPGLTQGDVPANVEIDQSALLALSR